MNKREKFCQKFIEFLEAGKEKEAIALISKFLSQPTVHVRPRPVPLTNPLAVQWVDPIEPGVQK